VATCWGMAKRGLGWGVCGGRKRKEWRRGGGTLRSFTKVLGIGGGCAKLLGRSQLPPYKGNGCRGEAKNKKGGRKGGGKLNVQEERERVVVILA